MNEPRSPATPPRADAPRQLGRQRAGWVFAGTPREAGDPQGPPASQPQPEVYRPAAPPPASPSRTVPAAFVPAVEAPGRRSGRGARVLAAGMAVVLVMAMIAFGITGMGGQGHEVVPDEGVTISPTPTSNQATSRSQQPGEREPGPGPEPEEDGAPVDPGDRDWVLPERTWEQLPQLEPSDEFWVHLQTADVYGQNPVTLLDCPEPATVQTESDYRSTVRAQWSCVHAAWVPVFEAMGWSTVEPAVEFYPGKGSKSECGYLEAPAFYCSAGDGTAYFGGDHFVMAQKWDLSVNEMVNHEYGHHIQSLAGLTSAKQQVVGTDDVERRSELQATCWSAMMTYHNRTFEFGQQDYDSWQARLDTMLVDGVHGSRESLRYWGTRGLYAETLNDCNTWAVESDHVS